MALESTRAVWRRRSVRQGLGSPLYMAPEIVRAERGADGWQKADIWGVGCIMYELATGRAPWVSCGLSRAS